MPDLSKLICSFLLLIPAHIQFCGEDSQVIMLNYFSGVYGSLILLKLLAIG